MLLRGKGILTSEMLRFCNTKIQKLKHAELTFASIMISTHRFQSLIVTSYAVECSGLGSAFLIMESDPLGPNFAMDHRAVCVGNSTSALKHRNCEGCSHNPLQHLGWGAPALRGLCGLLSPLLLDWDRQKASSCKKLELCWLRGSMTLLQAPAKVLV